MDIKKRPTILLCWGYNRKNWIEFFEALSNDFEFIYLFYMTREEEQQVFTENRRIFYTDFSSPRQLLKKIRPSKVIFMGLDGLQTIGLNIQARKMGIPTYFMAHGSATLSLDDYRDFRFAPRNIIRESFSKKLGSWWFTFWWITKALGARYIGALPQLMKFQVSRLKMHPLLAMAKWKSVHRRPDRYIVFSEEDVKFYSDLDDSSRDDFTVLGNLEITSAIKLAEHRGVTEDGYLLYIETPLSVIEGNEFDINKLTIEEVNGLISSMNNYAMHRGWKLIVKLHPYSFSNSFFIKHPNIHYEKGSEKEALILGANAIVFYNSSLSIPSLFFKPCSMFLIGEADEFQSVLRSTGICQVLDYKTLINDPGSLRFEKPSGEARSAFIEKYIGKGADGKGLERLKETLLS